MVNDSGRRVCISMLKNRPQASRARISSTMILSSERSLPTKGLRISTLTIGTSGRNIEFKKCTVTAVCCGLPSISLQAKSTRGSIPKGIDEVLHSWKRCMNEENYLVSFRIHPPTAATKEIATSMKAAIAPTRGRIA